MLNLLLLVERTEVAFYREALSDARLTGEMQEFAQVVLEHETEHVAGARGRARLRRGRGADVRLRRRHAVARRLRAGRGRPGGRRRRRLQRPGRQRRARRVPARGPDRLGRGAPRGVDPQHRGSRPGARRRRLAAAPRRRCGRRSADRGDGMSADFGLDLARLDRDGALAEARAGLSRRGLLVGVAAGAGGALLLRGGVARAQTRGRRRRPELRARARVPPGRLLHGGGAVEGDQEPRRGGGQEGRRRRAGARQGVPRPARGARRSSGRSSTSRA